MTAEPGGVKSPPPMRILIAHALYPPDFAGGGEYVVQQIAEGLKSRGAEVRVITTGDPALNLINGVSVRRLPVSRYRFNLAVRAICDEARDADVIQTFNYHACVPAWLSARIMGKPVCCEILGLFGREWRGLRGAVAGRAFEAWESMLLRIPYDSVVFLSEHSRQCADTRVPDRRAFVCNPGISLEHYHCGPKEDHVLFAGKLDSRKGLDAVLAAARLLPRIDFKFFGWGEPAEIAKTSGLPNVHFVPFERGQPLYDAFACARIFVLPSRAEPFGLAAVEAMASGCALVSSVPLPFEGERVDADDVTGLASAIDRLWKDRSLTERMGRENMRLAQQYTWSRNIDFHWNMYEQLLHRRSVRPRCEVGSRQV